MPTNSHSTRQRSRGDREPAPQPHARQRIGRGGDDREIDVERPVARLVRGDQQRRHVGADEAEPAERRAVQQRGGERRERDEAEQHEGRAGERNL